MTKKYKSSAFIFRRDLRLGDNNALNRAIEESQQVTLCFIFDPKQVKDNAFKGDYILQFMLESLRDLQQQIEKQQGSLYFFYDTPENIIDYLAEKSCDAIFCNRDYTPFSRKRDAKIKSKCKKNDIDFCQLPDALLTEPEHVFNLSGKPYKVFSAFMKKARLIKVSHPQYYKKAKFNTQNLSKSVSLKSIYDQILQTSNKNLYVPGGRTYALKKLKKMKQYTNYKQQRDYPSIHGTTGLSAHNKFGTISVREFYHTVAKDLGETHTIISELYWRDFFTHIAYHFPNVFQECFHKKYEALKWLNNKKHFHLWCKGKTGYPIVDAGMRELNTTGYMHNRVRMIVASFLTKHLHIDWRWGEKYFAQKLIDYDPCVNNGNWQWAASTGCDAQPYFRIFNPWLQQKKFDADVEYIKKWVPELRDTSAKDIHNWFKEKYEEIEISYPRPIVDHTTESKKAKTMFSSLKEQ
ncbi:deoxyribodipyrimidine photo-lyase [Candidatus Uabimicrobium sp. HlEnr_7]|uniref:cryptochrome/photolyase family protein n=1 Tax=Candidatus Uabimicrobium helgolandensis TaxID=3095367 RepID=UPI003556D182